MNPMSVVKKYVAYRLFLLLLLILPVACVSVSDLKIGQIKDVQVAKVDGNAIDVSLSMPVENQNSFSIKVKNANLDVYANDKLIGMVQQIDPLVFPGKSNSIYVIKMKVNLSVSMVSLLPLMNVLGGKPPVVRLKGSLKVGGFLLLRTVQVDQLIPLRL
jgi:LEA14-like dessication related protein